MAIDYEGIKLAAAAQGGVAPPDPAIAAALARIDANRSVQPVNQQVGGVDTEGIALAAKAQATIPTGSSNQLPTVVLPSGETAVRIEITGSGNVGTAETTSSGTAPAAATTYDPFGAEIPAAGQPLSTPTVVEIAPDSSRIAQVTASDTGNGTETPVSSSKEVSPEEDPFEKARQDAIANENESPTEQAVIDAGQDAKLSQEEQGQLREYQETQRAQLKEESDKGGNPEQPAPSKAPAATSTAQSVDKQKAKQPDPPPTFKQPDDWRIRLSLAPNANYLYNVATANDILFPLKETKGVVFPYVPQINTAYRANYNPVDIPHTNYKSHFYQNSSVDDISIIADFTAQDTFEAKYLLAVMHFFKSATKMFYGQDKSPRAGTPPPLLYLSGMGKWQFDNHPLVVTGFQLNLPNDVDYIRTNTGTVYSQGKAADDTFSKNTSMRGIDFILDRLKGSKLSRGGGTKNAGAFNYLSNKDSSYVPTKVQLSLTVIPIVSRKDISDNFSLAKYATGELLKGSKRNSGGMW